MSVVVQRSKIPPKKTKQKKPLTRFFWTTSVYANNKCRLIFTNCQYRLPHVPHMLSLRQAFLPLPGIGRINKQLDSLDSVAISSPQLKSIRWVWPDLDLTLTSTELKIDRGSVKYLPERSQNQQPHPDPGIVSLPGFSAISPMATPLRLHGDKCTPSVNYSVNEQV